MDFWLFSTMLFSELMMTKSMTSRLLIGLLIKVINCGNIIFKYIFMTDSKSIPTENALVLHILFIFTFLRPLLLTQFNWY